jgi:hypothetical protein
LAFFGLETRKNAALKRPPRLPVALCSHAHSMLRPPGSTLSHARRKEPILHVKRSTKG